MLQNKRLSGSSVSLLNSLMLYSELCGLACHNRENLNGFSFF